MDVFVSFCVGSAVVSMVLALIFMLRSQEAARKAVLFADDARNWMNDALSERLCVQAIEEEVEQRATGLEAWAKSLVEKLEGTEYMAVESAKQAADIAEVVKLEVAKIETLIAKLNKDRAENPPFVAITYGEESGEPEKVEVSINEKGAVDAAVERLKECRDEIIKHAEGTITTTIKGFDGVLRGYTVVPLNPLLPNGQPFEFKPTQVHPVITEGGE